MVIRGKYIAIQAYLKKQENSQINNLTLHLKELKTTTTTTTTTTTNPKASKRREIIKNRVEVSDKETEKKKTQNQNKSMKPGAGSLKKLINLINP